MQCNTFLVHFAGALVENACRATLLQLVEHQAGDLAALQLRFHSGLLPQDSLAQNGLWMWRSTESIHASLTMREYETLHVFSLEETRV